MGDEREALRIQAEWLSFIKRCSITASQAEYQPERTRQVFWVTESQYTAKTEADRLPVISLDTLLAVGTKSVIYLLGEEGAARLVQGENGRVNVDAIDMQGRRITTGAHLLQRDQRIELSSNSVALPIEELMRTSIHLGKVVGVLLQHPPTELPSHQMSDAAAVPMLPGVSELIARYRAYPGFIRPEVPQR